MTSANVTNYYVYRNGTLILDESQHHFCKNRINDILRAVENPEQCRLKIIWPDEHESPQEQFNGELTDHIKKLDERKAWYAENCRKYQTMKENGTW